MLQTGVMTVTQTQVRNVLIVGTLITAKNQGIKSSDICQTSYGVYWVYGRFLWHYRSTIATPHRWFDSLSDSTLRVLFAIGVMGSLLTSPANYEIMVL